jgi:hypothetical protein
MHVRVDQARQQRLVPPARPPLSFDRRAEQANRSDSNDQAVANDHDRVAQHLAVVADDHLFTE